MPNCTLYTIIPGFFQRHSLLPSFYDEFLFQGDRSFTLESANRIYVQKDFKLLEKFQSLLSDHYDAPGQSVDFERETEATRVMINKWVEDFTHEKIKDILPEGNKDINIAINCKDIKKLIAIFYIGSLNGLTRLVLVNAVYFKGNWLREFDAGQTEDAHFYLGSLNKKVNVRMMHIRDEFQVGSIESLDARVLKLSYTVRRQKFFKIRL